jgi:large subunit ribosomal protein L23
MKFMQKSPYDVIKKRYVTEKTAVLSNLRNMSSNRCLSRCESPKYTFMVDSRAKKPQIAEAIESIYVEKNIKVVAVNTINVKPKVKNRRGKMNQGQKGGFKKAVVTLAVGNSID